MIKIGGQVEMKTFIISIMPSSTIMGMVMGIVVGCIGCFLLWGGWEDVFVRGFVVRSGISSVRRQPLSLVRSFGSGIRLHLTTTATPAVITNVTGKFTVSSSCLVLLF
jgi:hypothetical protein